MIGRVTDEISHHQIVFMTRITRKYGHKPKDELKMRRECMYLIKVDMCEFIIDKAMKQWTPTKMSRDLRRRKVGKHIMTLMVFLKVSL